MGVSKLQPQNASLPLNSKIGNLTQIDILYRDGCEVSVIIPSSAFPSSGVTCDDIYILIIFLLPAQRALNHPAGPNSITHPSLTPALAA